MESSPRRTSMALQLTQSSDDRKAEVADDLESRCEQRRWSIERPDAPAKEASTATAFMQPGSEARLVNRRVEVDEKKDPMLAVLRKKPEERDEDDIALILRAIYDVKFFRSLADQRGVAGQRQVCVCVV